MAVTRLMPWLALALGGCLGLNPAFDDGDEAVAGSGDGSGTHAMSEAGAGPGSMSMSATASDSASDAESGSSAGNDVTSGGPPDSACAADDPDLVLCFDFETVVGNTLLDGSMYGHDAIVVGAELVDSPWGKGLVANDGLRVEVPCFEDCETVGPLTIEARVRIDEPPPPGGRIGIVDNDEEYAITYSDAGVRCANGPPTTTVGSTLPLDAWVHLACVNDGETLRLYIDGVEGGSADVTAPGPTGDPDPVAIANTAPSWNEPLIGMIDRVRVWTRARTPEELADPGD